MEISSSPYRGLVCQRYEVMHEYIRLLRRPLTTLERRAFMHFLDLETDDSAKWAELYHEAVLSPEHVTFLDLEREFATQYGYTPQRDLPLMPRQEGDWFRSVRDLKGSSLHPARPGADLKIEHAPDCLCAELVPDIVRAIEPDPVDCLVAHRDLDDVPGTPSERYKNIGVPFMQGIVVRARIKREHASELLAQAQDMLAGFMMLLAELHERHRHAGYECPGDMIDEAFPQLKGVCLAAHRAKRSGKCRDVPEKQKSAARTTIEDMLHQWVDVGAMSGATGLDRRQVRQIVKARDLQPRLEMRINGVTGQTDYRIKGTPVNGTSQDAPPSPHP